MTSVVELAKEAKQAASQLAVLNRARKDEALAALADELLAQQDQILAANELDVAAAKAQGVSAALIDRLSLSPARVSDIAAGLRQLAALPDPIGEVVRGWQLANGAQVSQVRVPLGVIGIIYEARPNVTADAAGICLKSGNACLLRGSSSALNSNRAIVAALQAGLAKVGLQVGAISLVEGGHETTTEMMQARGLIDVLIPRGGAGLINAVVNGSKVPVLETGTGNCHLYVDKAANQQMALDIMLNAKTQRPSVCNALETMLVHQDIAAEFLAKAMPLLSEHGVTVHGDEASCALDQRVVPAKADEYDAEYLSLDLALKIVPDIAAAIAHIKAHSTGHSETIISDCAVAQNRFVAEIDAAAVLVNASSRFVDGGEFGFGAEIGISTQKFHARGPMGLPEMTATKYVVRGQGQVRK